MSAIFGLVNLDGLPVPLERLETMRCALDGWGPDGDGVRIKGFAGLGHALLCTTPEAPHEQMPWETPGSGIVITAAARLDNRDELCDFFQIPAPERPVMADGRLVALAYARWREDAPSHLLGDWSLAAWDERRRRLFVARDHLGNTGLFYSHRPPWFAFASTPQAILSLPEFPSVLDEWQLARCLAIFPGEEEEWSCTLWRDVHLLLPAHTLTLTPETLQVQKYWRLDDAPPIRLGSQEEYLEGFRQHFRRAVQVRLRSDRPVGSTLSSGLDSSSVTALAAEALQAAGQPLMAFTSVPIHPAEHLVPRTLADEWPLAQTVAQKYPNIQHIPIKAESLHAAANLFWIMALHQEARRLGLGVILTGQLGNGGVSWTGGRDRIFFLLLQGRWQEGLRALRAYQEKQGCSWPRAIRRHLLRPLLGPWWQRRRRLLHPLAPPWGEYSAIHPDFARRMRLREAMRAAHHDPAFARPHSPAWERRLTIELNGAAAGPIWHRAGAAFRMDVRDPTADVALLTYCWGLPEDLHTLQGGERMTIRLGLAEVLPEEIRRNALRGRQAADVGLRLLDHRDEMEEELPLLENGAAAAYLDCDALRGMWRELLAGATPNTTRRAAALLRGVMAGRFLMLLNT
jgi:asparagine synthase (glutamine-hydrolysing)